MSSALAIASVTAVLRDLLNNGLIDNQTSVLGDVKVSVLPPDRIRTGDLEESQLNLFLYQVTPNAGWRNEGLPSRNGEGHAVSAPPLALDLHYLLTAYGAQDFHAEILLGYAMQLLHETPVLTRGAIRASLGASSLVNAGGAFPSTFEALSSSGLADQIETIKICPQALNTEESSKLWTALQARYRTTAAYHVSVVLIDSRLPVRPPLPVLRRGDADRGAEAQPEASLPRIEALHLPRRQSSALLDDELLLVGENFDGFAGVRFSHQRLPTPFDIASPLFVERSANQIKLKLLPNAPALLPDGRTVAAPWLSGPCTAAVVVNRNGRKWTSAPRHFSIAPRIDRVAPLAPARDAQGDVALMVKCSPPVKLAVEDATMRFDQQVELLFAEQPAVAPEAPPSLNPNAPAPFGTDTLVFTVPNPPPGKWLPRLRVDGVEMAPVDWTKTPPVFDKKNEVTVP